MKVYSTLFILSVLLFSAFATAFDSRGPNIAGVSFGESIHEDITEKALKEKGFSKKVIEKIEDANTDVDWDETSFSLWKFKLVVNEKYRPYHHFDRLPGITHKQAFRDGANYVKQEIENVVNAILNGDKEKAMEAMGKGLHALQDFFAHSNFVDLSEKDKERVLEGLFDPTKDVPSTLKLTGYDPSASDPGNPPNDEYPHDQKAKDSPDYNAESRARLPNGKTKFQEAFDQAVKATEKFADKVKERLREKLKEKLKEEGKEENLEEEFNELWDGFRMGKVSVTPLSYDKAMAMVMRYFPLIENINDENELLASFANLAKDFMNGVSPEYPFGRNEIFSTKISYAMDIVLDYLEKDDAYNASQIANLSIEYANRVIEDAEEKGIEIEEAINYTKEAEVLYEEGNYVSVLEKIADIDFPFGEIYPEFQEPQQFAVYVINVKANGKLLENERVLLKWEGYSQEIKSQKDSTILFAPAGNYEAVVPVDIKIFGIKIKQMTLAKMEGAIDNEGIVTMNIVISTYFIPYDIAKFLIEHFLSIIIVLILIGTIVKILRRRKE